MNDKVIIRACPLHTESWWTKIPKWLYCRTIAQLANAGCNAIGMVVDCVPANVPPHDLMGEMLLPFEHNGEFYDLTKPDKKYFAWLREMCQVIRGYGCTPHLMLFMQEYGNWPRWSPWQRNVQGMTSLYYPPNPDVRNPFIDAVVAATIDLDPIYFVGCELGAEMPALIELHTSTLSRLMEYHKVSIRRCGFGFDFFPYMKEGGDNYGATLRRGVETFFLHRINPETGLEFYDRTSWDLWNYCHQVGTPDDSRLQVFFQWHSGSGINHMLSEDGKIPRMTPAEAIEVMQLILTKANLFTTWGIDFHPSEYFLESQNHFGWDVDLNQLTHLKIENIKAVAAKFKEWFGIWPENKDRYLLPEPEPEPEPKPKPPEPKPQPKKEFSLLRWFREDLGWRVLSWKKRNDWFGIPDWWAISSVKQKVISLAIVAAVVALIIKIL